MENKLSTNISFLRKRLKMSQQEVANMLGVPRSNYSGWEIGRNEPDIKRIILLSKVYCITIDDLLKADLGSGEYEDQFVLTADENIKLKSKINQIKSILHE